MNANATKYRHRIKQQCCEYKGGKCADCGYSDLQYLDVFDFHHLDPKDKDFDLGGCSKRFSWDKIQPELDKCVMLCARCHRIRHARENTRIDIQRINNQTSKEDIDEIRGLYKCGGITIRELSSRFEIPKSTIHRLIQGCILDSQKEPDTLGTPVVPH
jgi:hypothetical protein